MRNTIFWVSTLLVLVVPSWMVFQKESHLQKSKSVFLRLAPVDPRSLMQGDYMILRYRISRPVPYVGALSPRGKIVLFVDSRGVGSFRRFAKASESLGKGEILLKYKKRKWDLWYGAESFFFQEGHAKYYTKAVYGELKISASGDSVLVGLRDRELRKLSAPKHVASRKTARRAHRGPILARPPTSRPSSAKTRPSTKP